MDLSSSARAEDLVGSLCQVNTQWISQEQEQSQKQAGGHTQERKQAVAKSVRVSRGQSQKTGPGTNKSVTGNPRIPSTREPWLQETDDKPANSKQECGPYKGYWAQVTIAHGMCLFAHRHAVAHKCPHASLCRLACPCWILAHMPGLCLFLFRLGP